MQIRENGFVPIVVVAIIVLLTLAIVGGTYLVVSYTPIFKSQAQEVEIPIKEDSAQNTVPAPAVENPPTAETANPSLATLPKGKVITITRNQASSDKSPTTLFNLDTKQTESIMKSLEDTGELIIVAGVAPDRSKMILITMNKGDLSALTTDAIPKELPNYYICANPCTEVRKLDKQKIEQQLTQKEWWFPQAWVANSGNKLLITTLPQTPKVDSLFKTEVAVLDIDTMELSSFLTDDMLYFAQNNFYLDPKNDLFITYNKTANSELQVSSYSLTDNKRSDYPVGKILNLHPKDINLDSVGGFGPFYVAIPPGEELANMKSLLVKSLKNQDIGLALLPTDLKAWHFGKKVFWSDSGNYFGIEASDIVTKNRNSMLLIFAKEGTLISSIDLDRDRQLHSVIFSPDDKKIITTTYDSDKNESKWQIFSLTPTPKPESDYIHPALTFPISWNY